MTVTATTPHTPARSQANTVSTRVFDSLAAAEPVWRDLETRAVLTPYQRFDWIRGYIAAGFPIGRLAILVISVDDHPIGLLPFEIVRRFGLRIAQLVGMPISNGDAMLFDPRYAEKLDPAVLRRSLSGLGADLVNFHSVAARTEGIANPLLGFPATPSPDNFYFNELVPGDEPYIEQSLPHKRRTNIRRSERRLEEGFGPLRLHRAATEGEVDDILEVFLDQRGRRFVQMGVANVFASPEFRRLFRTLAIEQLQSDRPALSLHALYAGEAIVATSVGTYGPRHYSQYINSTDSGEASRYSLMGVMLSRLVDQLRANGITAFDMGLGDFDYKTDWTQRQVVHDVVIATSPLGVLARPLLQGARGLKRTIKQTPALWNAARAVRSALARLRGGAKGP